MSEFKYLGCVLDESSTNEAVYRSKVASGRRVTGVIRGLQLKCGRVYMRRCSCLFVCMVVRMI